MSISVKIENEKRLKKRMKGLERLYKKELKTLQNTTARLIRTDARKSITKSSGKYKLYRVHIKGRRKNHWSSPPGTPPNNMTGNLRSSIVISERSTNNKLVSKVTAQADYAFYLEFGTARMAPRPFLRPASREHIKRYRRTAKAIVKRASAQGVKLT